jgi:hypothetical protein
MPPLPSPRLRRLAVLALLLAALAGCTTPGKRTRGSSRRPSGSAATAPSARGTLTAYLDATFAGRHQRAWTLLTRGDQTRLPQAAYVREQREVAAMRTQVEALGKTKRYIARISERNDRANAVVVLKTGLGAEEVRFVLRREQGRWRVDYRNSWAH